MPKVTLDLTGQWQFKQYPLSARKMDDLDTGDWHETTIPSSIYTSLIEAGQIQQTDIDANPENFSSISEHPWIYRKTFDADNNLLNCDRIDLVFDGLDTITSIWLNDKLIGKTNNMFIAFKFNITGLIKPKDNVLLVKFEPPNQYAKKLMEKYTSFSESDFSNPHRIYIRKAQYQFGWDFCPSLPGCGIWRPVRLEGVKKARIADVQIRTVDCNQQYADIKITVALDVITKQDFLCRLSLSAGDSKAEHNMVFRAGEHLHSAVLRIENPLLWWPAGFGHQHLYTFNAELLSIVETIDQVQKQIGIRTIKLNRQPADHIHKTKPKNSWNFRFEVNGQPLYIKGANWIPASIFAGSVTNDDYKKLLNAAADANINMLRVWGGGYYESEKFYQLCDQLGIMVWQDFMFTCAYYPDQQWFLKEVKTEATNVIKQLRDHPCLALWCGNNEIDWMHTEDRLGKSKKFHGREIFHQILSKLITELNPDTDYIPSTPLIEQGKSKTPQTITTHQWGVWSGHQPMRQYQCPEGDIPLFVTEFGFQSLPAIKTLNKFCKAEQMRIGSYQIEKHNYQLDGNSRLYRYIGDLFGSAENIEQFAYLSQITQARSAKKYIEYLRANNSINTGALFWQFNDCSPAISWSAFDSEKEPKALYYYAKRFFSKLLVAAIPQWHPAKSGQQPELKAINVFVINDNSRPLTATLQCRLIDLTGNVCDKVAFPIALGPFTTSAKLKLPKAITFPAKPDRTALHLVIEREGKNIVENLYFYLPDKYIDWPRANFDKQLSQINEQQWLLKLKADCVAKDVQISFDTAAGYNNNFIDIIPPGQAEILIDCQPQITLTENELKLRTITKTD